MRYKDDENVEFDDVSVDLIAEELEEDIPRPDRVRRKRRRSRQDDYGFDDDDPDYDIVDRTRAKKKKKPRHRSRQDMWDDPLDGRAPSRRKGSKNGDEWDV